jgi:hypothetical protein
MKRLVLFAVLAALGLTVLFSLAGDLTGPAREEVTPVVHQVDPARAPTGHPIKTGGRTIEAVEGLVQTAPPERILWKDRLSDETIEIPVFFPWRFRADDLVGTQPADADTQGVMCRNVRFFIYRQPTTRAEAIALRSGDKNAYEALLNQTFRADEARVFGRLGEALNRNKSSQGSARLGDTKLILSRNVHVVDLSQGLDVRGEPATEVTVWPEQGLADGRGPFVMTHEAFTLTGDGLYMEHEKEAGWASVKILRNPVLRIHSDVHDANGNPMFEFGNDDFEPTHIVSQGSAILHRQTNRRETVLKITFVDRVRAEQQGGRSIDAGRVELVASQATVPRAGSDTTGWSLQHFLAEDSVVVEYPGRTRKGEAYLASITANRLVHEVPGDGLATTELEGDIVMTMRGEIPLLGPGGRLRASCRDSATIGPLRQGSPTGGHDPNLLQEISLRGAAHIERTEHGLELTEDMLEAEAIDLVVLPKESTRGVGAGGPMGSGSSGMIAIHFAARDDVRIGGTRIRGNTHRLIGEALDTDRPRILAEGPGTRFVFPNLGGGESFLGPEKDATGAPAGPASAVSATDAPSTEEGTWLLERLLATGLVDIDTSLGGPSIGIPAQVSGDELSYSRTSQQAQVRSRGSRQARIAWTAPTGEVSHLETRVLTLDQSQGRITATEGLSAEIYVSQSGLGTSPLSAGRAAGDTNAPSSLSVRTDERIEVELVRDPATGRPALGSEQLIKITGPLTAELRAENRTVDRLKAEMLELALVYATPEAAAQDTRPLGPTARPARSGPRGETSRTRPTQGKRLERVELTAREMRLDVADGEARYIEASQMVEMKSKEGRITGDRISYDGQRRQVEVLATRPDWKIRPAVAWLGVGDERMEIQGVRLALTLDGKKNRPAMLEADSAATSPAVMHLYRRSDGSLPGDKDKSPKQTSRDAGVEWFTLSYWGSARMVNSEVTIDGKGAPERGNQTVRIVRRLRPADSRVWGPPSVLWSPTLRVLGSNMLASDGAVREIRQLIAEGYETTMRSGRDDELMQVWGHRFEFDVLRREATLRGLQGRPVRLLGNGIDSELNFVIIDMKTNLPTYMDGTRVRWRPAPAKPKSPAKPK